MTKRKCSEKRLRQNTFLKGAKSKKINIRTILPFTFNRGWFLNFSEAALIFS
jgi:hypothetical protein